MGGYRALFRLAPALVMSSVISVTSCVATVDYWFGYSKSPVFASVALRCDVAARPKSQICLKLIEFCSYEDKRIIKVPNHKIFGKFNTQLTVCNNWSS